jgi:DNA-directed RNA polymerase subunit RPC12/RpoP
MAIEAAFACPGCGRAAESEDLEAAADLSCPCGFRAPRREGSVARGRVLRCALCGDPRLYRQKDFGRGVGIGLLVAGFALAVLLGVLVGPWGFFAALGASVALDALLYLVAGEVVICHWCETHYRGGPEDYPEFDLALHDLVRYQRSVAAAGQRVPDHEGAAGAPALADRHPTEYDGPRTPPGV